MCLALNVLDFGAFQIWGLVPLVWFALIFFETGSYMSQAGLELGTSLRIMLSSCCSHLYLLSAGVIDVCHHTLIILILYFQMKDVKPVKLVKTV